MSEADRPAPASGGTTGAARESPRGAAPPLVVDLEGALLPTDPVQETLAALAARGPRGLARIGAWLAMRLRSRAAAQAALAEAFLPDPATLPWRAEALGAVRAAQAEGRRIVLIAAADRRFAEAAAAHLGPFDAVLASDGRRRLDPGAKAARLEARYGAGGFDLLAGPNTASAAIALARRVLTAGLGPARRREATRAAAEPAALRQISRGPGPGGRLALWIRALRPHQWAKNLLVFLPLLAVHGRTAEPAANALIAFTAFSMIASSAYLINDLLDLESDRAHPRKRRRPFAAGALPLGPGALAAAALLSGGLLTAASVSGPLALVAAIYAVATLAYSLALKRIVLLDVCALGALYSLRVIAGAVAVDLSLSAWMLAMSGFLFFALAAMKRQVELHDAAARGREPKGRGYRTEDLPVVAMMAVAAGFMSTLLAALWIYTRPIYVLYESPTWLWAAPAIMLFWLLRMIMLADRGSMNDDPVVFALRDRISHLCAAGVVGFGLVAKYL